MPSAYLGCVTTRTAIPDPVVKRLYALSRNRCAFPGCAQELTVGGIPNEPPVNVGKIAHIVGHSRQGPRGGAELSEAGRLRIENLLLLCGVHHDLVDNLPRVYSVPVLQKLKADHEARHGGQDAEPSTALEMYDETVDLTVMPVTALPSVVFTAPTSCKTAAEVDEGIRTPKGNGEVVPFLLLAGEVVAFHDLSHELGPFGKVVDHAKASSTPLDALVATQDGHNHFVWLLNRALVLTLQLREVGFDRSHKRYYLLPTPETIARWVDQVTKLGRKTRRQVVRERKRRGEGTGEWWHDAAQLRFEMFDVGQWGLTVRPEFHLTSDGTTPLASLRIGRRVTRKKSHMYNEGYFDAVHWWRGYLSEASPNFILRCGPQRVVISSDFPSVTATWPRIRGKVFKPKGFEPNLLTVLDEQEALSGGGWGAEYEDDDFYELESDELTDSEPVPEVDG